MLGETKPLQEGEKLLEYGRMFSLEFCLSIFSLERMAMLVLLKWNWLPSERSSGVIDLSGW